MVTTRSNAALAALALIGLGSLSACRHRPDVALPPSSASADSVQVGYGARARGDLTTAVSSIDRQQMRRQQATSVADLLERLPGVRVIHSTNGLSVRVRSAKGEPLYVVDGMPRLNFAGTSLASLRPSDIDRIDVLKDGGATAAYGLRGGNGVILITTRGFR